MSTYSTVIRATHLVTNAAWFGGSLMGAVGLNPAARQVQGSAETAKVEDAGWSRWGPVQGAAIGLHVLSGLAITIDNRRRVIAHGPTRSATALKTVLTGGAIAGSAAAYWFGAELSRAHGRQDHDPEAKKTVEQLSERMRWLQWVTPATTAGLLVLDAHLGEQQRGAAGMLDAPTG